MTPQEILATNLANFGYGMTKEQLLPLLQRFTEDELREFTYNLYRTAEKMGPDGFDCDELWGDKQEREHKEFMEQHFGKKEAQP